MPERQRHGGLKREAAALLLARGESVRDVARELSVSDRTIFHWLKEEIFRQRVRERQADGRLRRGGRHPPAAPGQ
jgi:transposase-like protein